MCSDIREGETFPELDNGYWYWGRPTMAESSRRSEGRVQEHSARLRLGGSGVDEAWERGDRDQFVVDTLEEPIRYTGGKGSGIKR